MNLDKRHFALLFSLLTTVPAVADEVHLIYPRTWCVGTEPTPLHFTATGMGTRRIRVSENPMNGRIYPDRDSMTGGGSYVPRCADLEEMGFDFFGLVDGSDNRFGVTVLLGDGSPSSVTLLENALDGTLGHGWSAFPEVGSPSPAGVEIVEWQGGSDMEGTHGFRVSAASPDKFLSFRFGEHGFLQPLDPNTPGTNGVTTEIVVKPPPPSGGGGELPQDEAQTILYAAGRFEGGEADTVLRLRRRAGGTYSIRAEAAATTGAVATDWCPLEAGLANSVKLRHIQTLTGEDTIALFVNQELPLSCVVFQEGFVSARPPAPEYRVGAMASEGGYLQFDFDQIRVQTMRFKPHLRPDVDDDFENGTSWNPDWQTVDPDALTITSSAAHTGQYGLLVEPTGLWPAYLQRDLPTAASEVACRLSLDADFISSASLYPRLLVFNARSSGQQHQVRVWLRHSPVGYQIRAAGGSDAGFWQTLSELPADLFFNWKQGVLDIRIQGCQLSENGCRETLGSFTTDEIHEIRLGAVGVFHEVDHGLTFDNVQCLVVADDAAS